MNGALAGVARRGKEQVKKAYKRYERVVPAASFLAGVLYDTLTVSRISETSALLQLGFYLVFVATLIAVEIREEHRPIPVKGALAKIWKYREEAAHFCLGSMLSGFTILYFKSSSLLGSLAFLLLVAGLLVANELSALRRQGLAIRTLLYAVCLTSYLFCVMPLVFGHVGIAPFVAALFLSGGIFAAFLAGPVRLLLPGQAVPVARRLAPPYAAVLAAFLIFYFARAIPPVPLSLTHIGIYHDVQRTKSGYLLTSYTPKWKFWQTGDQSFRERPGDRLYCFFSVFSPGGFKESLQVRWLRKDAQGGWHGSDAVPVNVQGGRALGYRGFAFKANFGAGDWQVRIETSDAREIGRIYVTVQPDPQPSTERKPVEEIL